MKNITGGRGRSTASVIKWTRWKGDKNIKNMPKKCHVLFEWLLKEKRNRQWWSCLVNPNKEKYSLLSFFHGIFFRCHALSIYFDQTSVNFVNVLQAAIAPVDPKKRKKILTTWLNYYAFGSYGCKSCS